MFSLVFVEEGLKGAVCHIHMTFLSLTLSHSQRSKGMFGNTTEIHQISEWLVVWERVCAVLCFYIAYQMKSVQDAYLLFMSPPEGAESLYD